MSCNKEDARQYKTSCGRKELIRGIMSCNNKDTICDTCVTGLFNERVNIGQYLKAYGREINRLDDSTWPSI